MSPRPLSGRRVVTTRDEPGRLDSLLAAMGADVVHVPMIAIDEPPDDGASLVAALEQLGSFDWLVVTSQHGAERVGAAAARQPSVQLAAVGPTTAARLAELARRVPAVVPNRHTAAALVEAMPDPVAGEGRVLVVQADRADDTLTAGLRTKGFEVTTVAGYTTTLRAPTAAQRAAVLTADAVALASGSAAQAWAAEFGRGVPAIVVAIGPTTRRVATESGLDVTQTATDHTVEGLASAITSVLGHRP